MSVETLAEARPGRLAPWRRLWAAGPGLVFLAAAVGPQDFVSNAAAGITHGYGYLWALVLIVAARFAFLEATARYVLATGESLIAGYARLGPWALWMILAAVVIKRHAANLYQLLFLGIAANWLLPLPFPGSNAVWSLSFWAIGFLLMYRGRYRTVERWCRPLVILLGGSLACAAFLANPDPAAIAKGLLQPSLGSHGGAMSAAFVLMALAGTSAGSVSNLKYAAFIHEKGWRDPSRLGEQRIDLASSAIGLLVMSALIQVASVGILEPAAGSIGNAEGLLAAFAESLGPVGRLFIAVGLWAAVFSTFLGANTGYSLIVSDIAACLSKQPADGVTAGSRPAYRWALLWFLISPLYALWTDWNPVWLVLFASAVQLLLLPATAALLLALTASRERMGRLRNGMAANIVLALMSAAALGLVLQNVWEWLG